MKRLAKWTANHAFGIGCAIGILLSATWVSVAGGRSSTSSTMDPPQCSVSPSLPPEIQDWVALHCAVHTAIFADNTEPSPSYKFMSAITQPGTFTGLNHLNRVVSLVVAYAVPADLKNAAPELYARGIEATLVVGRLVGSAGSIPIQGTLFLPESVTDDTGYLLLINSTLTQQELDRFSVSSRIQAGPRVVNTVTGASTPLSGFQQSFQSLWASATDLSTLFCGCNPPTAGGGVDPECVELAYARYNIAVQAAQRTVEACMIAAIEAFVICMAVCAGTLLWIGIGVIGMAICAGACLAFQIRDMKNCVTAFNIALNAAQATLQLDLQACGVTIVGQ